MYNIDGWELIIKIGKASCNSTWNKSTPRYGNIIIMSVIKIFNVIGYFKCKTTIWKNYFENNQVYLKKLM